MKFIFSLALGGAIGIFSGIIYFGDNIVGYKKYYINLQALYIFII